MRRIGLMLLVMSAAAMAAPAAAACSKSVSIARRLACEQPQAARVLQNQVRRTLKDPEGARIRDARLYESEDGENLAVCGILNAKNGYGAYIGETRFISAITGLVRIADEEPEAFDTLWAMFCARAIR